MDEHRPATRAGENSGSSGKAADGGDAPAGLRRPSPLVAGIVLTLVALNLRPALSSLAPVLPEVMRTAGISVGAASVLTAAPVLCLGLFGFPAPRLAARFGPERTILAMLLMLAAGIALRGSAPSFPALFAGTVIAGAAIGVIGVLLPGLVKRDFPDAASLMTGVYTMALCTGAAGAAAATVPLQHALDAGPLAALAFWAAPAVIAAAAWGWLLPRRAARGGAVRRSVLKIGGLWRDPLAWQVTFYMGLQSSLAYVVFGWLAPILRDRGVDPVLAGFFVSASVLFQAGAGLTAPILAARRRSQSVWAAAMMGLTLSGLLGCLYAPLGTLWLWVVVLGLGQGGAFAIALVMIVLRSSDAHVAAHLSGMSQSVGYTLASAGPLAVGLLHDWTGSWSPIGWLFVAVCGTAALFGLAAGRALQVRSVSRPA
jgi:MFS transporter, CP family, cyanate transporter